MEAVDACLVSDATARFDTLPLHVHINVVLNTFSVVNGVSFMWHARVYYHHVASTNRCRVVHHRQSQCLIDAVTLCLCHDY